MENASKALSIAASVLIGVLLVALLVFAYYQFVEIPRQEEANAKTEQTAEFNKKYVAYNKQNLKGNKLISLLNMAIDNNITYEEIEEYQITIEVSGKGVNGSFNTNPNSYRGNENTMRENIKNRTYRCTGIEYHSNGRIALMTFNEI